MSKPSNICGPAVARIRHTLGITQEELRRRCQAAGWSVARSVLAKIESQSRSVSDLELLALARALKVHVGNLLGAQPTRKRIANRHRPLKGHAKA